MKLRLHVTSKPEEALSWKLYCQTIALLMSRDFKLDEDHIVNSLVTL